MKIKLLTGIGIFFLFAAGFRGNAANIRASESKSLLTEHSMWQQDTTKKDTTKKSGIVTGIVVDENSQPIPGVGIKSASGKGAVTDATGKFGIAVTGPAEVLTFTYLGYASVTRPAGAANVPLSIKMQPSATTLKDVQVVAVGYGNLAAKEVTSSVAHVGTEDFRQSGARNPLDLIQGKVAGLQLSRPGGSNPNSSVSVQLRGAVTTQGSGTPLYVIDGIPGGNPNLLQQDDIASVDILKDGSGAAIYGTSANAGVIIITTKKGKPGAPSFDYSSYARKEYLQNRPDFLTADEFRQRVVSGDIQQDDFGSNTDFFDGLINHDNISQNHNLALSGGTEQTTYRGSINYRNLQGLSRENGREEYTVRLNINQKGLDNKLNAQLNLVTNINKINQLGGGGWESESAKNPTLSNYNPDGSFRYDLTSTNEFARLEMETNHRKQQISSADAKIDYDIIPGLKASVFGSVTRDSYTDGQYRFKGSEDSMENSDFPGGGYAYKGDFLSQKYAIEPTLTFQRKIAEKHDLTAVAGYSYRYDIEESSSASNRGFLNDQFHEDNLNAGAALSLGKAGMSSSKSDNTLIAFFGRINYSFNNRYLLQFILRHEGSSKFGANNRWANFPAVSAGWNLSEEEFMKDVKFVNYLKLRAGYGVTGNAPLINNVSRVTLSTGGKYIFPDGNYYQTYGPDRNSNPDLRWESKRELNIGIDYRLFDNRLSGSVDVFKRTTKDLLDTYDSPQPAYVRESIFTNVGTISSQGIELALGYQAIQGKEFNWNFDVTASTTKNELESYSNALYKRTFITTGGIGGAGDLGNAFTTFEGGKIGVFYGKRFAGFTGDGKWLFYNRNGEAIRNDQINNSRTDLNATDLAPIGNAVPKYYMSMTNNFNYKNWDLRIFVRGKFDFDILNTTALSYANKTWSGNLLKETFTKYAEINDTYMYSDYYLEDGSFLKIDEITLGYNFKFKSKGFRNLRVYATGQNLVTFTGYSGNDPDYVLDTGIGNEVDGKVLGIDTRGPYPSSRSFLLGVNVGF
ncbi:SusC/RagA family TonB-linked outer membrane protein [Pedobacter ginsengisoli]|uniref:SusC/RagA family TonB-linked outer membrane protein n=1 Tax=Pedobacter ginsengisoli TaxID=363852 RepID=UPI00254FB3CF|nr:SusC/RagA family TonB-linked outer membrane protein [Pedobacter ginsengisoli]